MKDQDKHMQVALTIFVILAAMAFAIAGIII